MTVSIERGGEQNAQYHPFAAQVGGPAVAERVTVQYTPNGGHEAVLTDPIDAIMAKYNHNGENYD